MHRRPNANELLRLDTSMQRRDFIKLTAVTGASATLASCGNPEHQLIRFIPDDDLVPGVAEWKPSVCPLCPAGCGLTVRVMEADAEFVRMEVGSEIAHVTADEFYLFPRGTCACSRLS